MDILTVQNLSVEFSLPGGTVRALKNGAVTLAKGKTVALVGESGSGKTTVGLHRIAWLVQVEGVSPWGVLAVTFTNKAAREMKTRVANLLGHEGPGSLFDVLKRAGMVESLSAGTGMDTGEHATLDISMSLTREGLEHQDEIIALTFEYIDRIRDNGISQQRFNEMRQLAMIDFRFRERAEAQSEAMRLSRLLKDYPPEDVLSAPWLLERYAPDELVVLPAQPIGQRDGIGVGEEKIDGTALGR